jgi:hypothetical protein
MRNIKFAVKVNRGVRAAEYVGESIPLPST